MFVFKTQIISKTKVAVISLAVIAVCILIVGLVLLTLNYISLHDNNQNSATLMVWNQNGNEMAVPFNQNQSRAIAIPVSVITSIKDVSVDVTTGFVTYTGSKDAIVTATYAINLALPEFSANSIQHFVGIGENNTWLLVNPIPKITKGSNSNFSQIPITVATQFTSTTTSFTSVFTISKGQIFALCANVEDTTSATVYQFITCSVSLSK